MDVLKKIWNFIWNDNSVWSWLVNIVLAFLLIKFVVYPLLGLALGTNYPIVAVVSGSMEHTAVHPCLDKDNFGYCTRTDKSIYEICGKTMTTKQPSDFDTYWDICGYWYEKNMNISKREFSEYPFHNGFKKGDLMILTRAKEDKLRIGDIIVFKSSRPDPIIHRVVKISNNGYYSFQTKGDHNPGSINNNIINETNITKEKLLGKAVIRIPYLGWVKIGFVELLNLIF